METCFCTQLLFLVGRIKKTSYLSRSSSGFESSHLPSPESPSLPLVHLSLAPPGQDQRPSSLPPRPATLQGLVDDHMLGASALSQSLDSLGSHAALGFRRCYQSLEEVHQEKELQAGLRESTDKQEPAALSEAPELESPSLCEDEGPEELTAQCLSHPVNPLPLPLPDICESVEVLPSTVPSASSETKESNHPTEAYSSGQAEETLASSADLGFDREGLTRVSATCELDKLPSVNCIIDPVESAQLMSSFCSCEQTQAVASNTCEAKESTQTAAACASQTDKSTHDHISVALEAELTHSVEPSESEASDKIRPNTLTLPETTKSSQPALPCGEGLYGERQQSEKLTQMTPPSAAEEQILSSLPHCLESPVTPEKVDVSSPPQVSDSRQVRQTRVKVTPPRKKPPVPRGTKPPIPAKPKEYLPSSKSSIQPPARDRQQGPATHRITVPSRPSEEPSSVKQSATISSSPSENLSLAMEPASVPPPPHTPEPPHRTLPGEGRRGTQGNMGYLEALVEEKLVMEGICLTEEPYSDKVQGRGVQHKMLPHIMLKKI